MRCQQSRSLQLAVKILYGFVAFLVIIVAVLASLGEHQPSPNALFCSVQNRFHRGSRAAEIPAVTCATSPTRLWSQWLNSCSQHSSDLLANSAGSCWHQEWEARHRGGAGRLASPTNFSLCRSNVFAPARFTWQLLSTSRCFLHQPDILLGLKVVNLHLLQPFWGFQSREPVSERDVTP